MTNRSKKLKSAETNEHKSNKLLDHQGNFVRTWGSEYLKDFNISSVGIGHKIKDGKPTEEIAVQFTVKRKASSEDLKNIEPVVATPESFIIEGVEVPTNIFNKIESVLSTPKDATLTLDTGFAQNFLSFQVDLPELSEANKQNTFNLNGSEIINYTHFSLALNKERRFAFWVGWNIDGGKIIRLSRNGIFFTHDPRIPKKFQVGDELYAGNRLDRGHIARRADLIWGELEEAKKANKDSFYFTNITPQMDNFNQGQQGGLWGLLEDAVFEDADVENLRVCVFGGPVFREDDREFREVKIPREFWKVIVFVEDTKLKAKGFLLTQNLDELAIFEFDEFKVYQVALSEIESRCGLTFAAALKAGDTFGERLIRKPEALSQRKPLASLKDINWS
jgi:endonuclease G